VAATIKAGTQAAEGSANVDLRKASAGPLTIRRREKAKPVAPKEIKGDTEITAPVKQLLESSAGPGDSELKEEGQKGGRAQKRSGR
jgi:hypothetical protein